MYAFFDSAPLIVWALEGHPDRQKLHAIFGSSRPYTTEVAIEVAVTTVNDIESRNRDKVLRFAGNVFAMQFQPNSTLTSADIERVRAVLPQGPLGIELSKDLGHAITPGVTGADLHAFLDQVVNQSRFLEPEVFNKILRLYVEVVVPVSDSSKDLDQALRGTLSLDEIAVVLAAHEVGRKGKNVTIITHNKNLLKNEDLIREVSAVASIKTIDGFIRNHVEKDGG